MKASSCLAGKQLHGTRLLSASVASRACFVDARAGEGCTAVRTKLLEMPGACDFFAEFSRALEQHLEPGKSPEERSRAKRVQRACCLLCLFCLSLSSRPALNGL